MPKKHTGVAGESVTYSIPDPAGGVKLETFIPWTLVKRGVKKEVITPIDSPREFLAEAINEREARKAAQDTPLVRALGLAHYWHSASATNRNSRPEADILFSKKPVKLTTLTNINATVDRRPRYQSYAY